MSALKNAVIALASGAFFALLYAAGVLSPLEDRVYDFFLRGRPDRQRIDSVVFLDVDDAAIAYNGVFPWPRSVMADGLLRLKEYGALAAILDIEFIDKSPQGIDTVYFDRNFPADFEKTFQNINTNVSDLLGALRGGRLSRGEADRYGEDLLKFIREEGSGLFQRTSGIARDNDVYLAQAAALFGHTWATVNLQARALEGEQSRRRIPAEEKFAYPLSAAGDAVEDAFVDVLPPIPSFLEAVRGAGFTNVFIDDDGVRRRIFLAQKVHDYWYLQLAFAPLMEYLGNPALRLERQRLILRNARIPGGDAGRDIVIPLDTGGRMMLDWPKTNFRDSFTHISFAEFSRLEELESQLEQYLAGLENSGLSFFAQFDADLAPASGLIYRINRFFDEAREARALALAQKSDEQFSRSVSLRAGGMGLLPSLLPLDLGARVQALMPGLERDYPRDAQEIRKEAEYIATLAEYLEGARGHYAAAENRLRESLEKKFCIIGRVDTGTTDIGVNPFYGEYVNVGTHAVVLDTILSGSFITPFGSQWSAALCLVFPLLLILAVRGLKPVQRAVAGGGGIVFFGAAFFGVFRYTGIFVGPLGPALSAFTAVVVRELVSYIVSDREKQFINKALSTYVSKDVVEELIANPALLQLGGSKRQMSAIFTDIQGFSGISEQLDPEQLVHLLNRYLTVMSDIIMENKGTIDKYEGDAIIAFFGAPVYRADHAALACRSAIRIKQAEAELNLQIMEEHLSPSPLYTRIGINTGEMVVGNMGTSDKMNYTIMGNAVNLAARLEGVNKQYNTGGILMSEYTRKETGNEFLCRGLDRVRVVGINTPVRLYELLGLRAGAGAAQIDAFAAWQAAMVLYQRREFTAAGEIFDCIAAHDEKDRVARLYAQRCRDYLAAPPPDDWDGINNLIMK
ncbi:MAG: adenylate/guanylate cyclase domain-containing protein [Spirochaetales bacterium]|jgi:adenylate cyclase|nr:adenylate/guanylate cyclase domain-containing protein [Spirochaetales bacterium]